MNIVFVSKECPPSPRSSGIGTYVWETGCALAHAGHRVIIIAASDDGQLASATPVAGLTVIRLPDDERDLEGRSIVARVVHAPRDQGLAYRRRVAECLRAVVERHDVDLVEFPGYRGESVAWLSSRGVVPVVVRMHGLTAGIEAAWRHRISASMRQQHAWENEELRGADIITAVSEHQARLVRAHLSTNCVQVVHNSIDTNHWANLAAQAPQELESNDILFVGNIARYKGIYVLLRAARELRRAGWRGRLVLAGRPAPHFQRSVRIRAALGISLPEWVVQFGMCPRDRLAGLYRDAGVCCFPSLSEAFSYTCLEAMACGGLVVATSETGMAELITESSGLLVPPGNVSALVSALNAALTMGRQKRSDTKQAAVLRATEHFDSSVIIPKLINVYERACMSNTPMLA